MKRISTMTSREYLKYLRGCLYRFEHAKVRDDERIEATKELIEQTITSINDAVRSKTIDSHGSYDGVCGKRPFNGAIAHFIDQINLKTPADLAAMKRINKEYAALTALKIAVLNFAGDGLTNWLIEQGCDGNAIELNEAINAVRKFDCDESKIVVIPTQSLDTLKWGLWSNKFQCWMHEKFQTTKGEAISHAENLGFKVAGLSRKGKL